jgi:uncharacterized membrane protein
MEGAELDFAKCADLNAGYGSSVRDEGQPSTMVEHNPYAAPTVRVADVQDEFMPGLEETLLEYGRRRPAHSGLEWIATSWQIFKRNPVLWIVAVVFGYGALMALSLVPVLNLLVAIASPLLTGGFAAMADASFRGRLAGIEPLLHGVRSHSRGLLLVGLSYVGFMAVTIGLLVLVDGPAWIQIALARTDPWLLEGRGGLLVVYTALSSLFGLAVLFAPALVVLHGVDALTAVKMSAIGVVKNVLPGVLCAFTCAILIVAAIIPLGLGLFVIFPMIMIVSYAAYRDVFLATTAA